MTAPSYSSSLADLASLLPVLMQRQLFVVSWVIFLDEKATAISVCWSVVRHDSVQGDVMAAANNFKLLGNRQLGLWSWHCYAFHARPHGSLLTIESPQGQPATNPTRHTYAGQKANCYHYHYCYPTPPTECLSFMPQVWIVVQGTGQARNYYWYRTLHSG